MNQSRWQRLLNMIVESTFDAMVFNPGPTLTYLTGLNFHLMERPTILIAVPGRQPVMILPELERAKIQSAADAIQAFTFGDNPATWQSGFTQALQSSNLAGKTIGVEPTRLRFLEMQFLQCAAPTNRYLPADEIVAHLRLCKDQDEVDCMRTAVRIAQDALKATLPAMKVGVSERELSSELTLQLLRAGSDAELPFSPIVASGPNSANPHAAPSDRTLQDGDLVVIDWGAYHRGYCSDLTRTFAIGSIEPEFEQIYRLVQSANAAGRTAARPAVPAGDVDLAARSVIDGAGFGKYYFHRTGHGLGMEGHEPPYIYAENKLILKPGMTFTVEPGIYLDGRGGVRIEDNVLITPEGVDVLSDFSRDLMVL